MSSGRRHKIIFALDPFEPELIPQPSALRWLKKWMKDQQAQVEAVFVSSLDIDIEDPAITQEEFSDYVKDLKLGEQVKAVVLQADSDSRKKLVDVLVQYAGNVKADFIVVSSHGRSGLERFVLGSFAETLLDVSPVPLLFLSQLSEGPSQMQKILFPTDFSEASRYALRLFLKELSSFKGELILYHADSAPGAVADTGVLGIPFFIPQDYWLDRRRAFQIEAEKIRKEVSAKGIKVRILIQDGITDTVSGIQHFAEAENIDLIAMASASHAFDRLLTGSIAHQILRQHHWPIWVCGPHVVGGLNTDFPRQSA
jgi:nucleotide-binding universal stress UspA family protein